MIRRSFLRQVFGCATAPVAIALLPTPAHATLGDYAREWTQILNKIQLLQQYIRQGQELRQKIIMVLDMAKNTAQLPMQIFGPIAAEIAGLHSVVQQGRALAYSMANLDQEFTRRFQGFRLQARSVLPGVSNLVADHARHDAWHPQSGERPSGADGDRGRRIDAVALDVA